MTIDLEWRRRFYAEEIEAVGRLTSRALVEALAAVPRERFLPPGPWTVLAEADLSLMGPSKTRHTPDADPARVYHNIGIAIDASRHLFNGQPGALAPWIEALDLTPGARVMHVGAGLGYYTAVMAHCVGSRGRVLAFEADRELAETARSNLAFMPWVEVCADAAADPGRDEPFEAILVNAGVTHPLDCWLDALAPGGRMILPLTSTMPAMGNIGKGFVFLLARSDDGSFTVKLSGFVAVYSAVGLRDETMNAALGKAMMTGLARANTVTRLRRDEHEPSPACWLHGRGFCLTA
jgi:protein-L-isoaspartate(D-aspartate) O-methyltransferase